MIVADAGAGLCTLLVALLLFAGGLQLWQIYLLTAITAAFGTVQWPAYAATTTLLVSKENLGRANGMVQFGQAASEVLAPMIAGALVGIIQLQGVILIDVVTFAFAIVTLLLVRFPKARASAKGVRPSDGERTRVLAWRDLTFGWTYITSRPGLLGLLLFSAVVSFIWGMVGALIVPMILGWSSSEVLGVIISVAGAGMLVGSLLMSMWGGPRRRINGVLNFEILSGLFFVLIGMQPSFWWTAAGVFGAHLTIAIIYGSNQAIWQSKVAPDVQGRVFAMQQMVTRAAAPLAYLLAGPLADNVFEPLLATNGPLAGSLGPIFGTGAGRGIGLLFVLLGVVKVVVSLVGRLYPHIRNVEDELPDAIPVQAEL
jgi:MFS family permease